MVIRIWSLVISSGNPFLHPLNQPFAIQRLAEEIGRADVRQAVERFHRRVAADDDQRDLFADDLADLLREDQAASGGSARALASASIPPWQTVGS